MQNSRIKNVSRNMVSITVFQFTKILFAFLGRIIFLKILSPSYLGINGLFSNILTVLTLTDLGINTAFMYCLYKPIANNDREKLSAYLYYFKKLYNIIALIILILGLSLIPFLKYLINLPNEIDNIYIYYILLLINTVASYLYIYKTTILLADQKMYIVNKIDIIFQFILLISQMFVLIFTHSYMLYLICLVLCTFLSNIIKAKKVDAEYKLIKNDYSIPKDERKKIFINMKSLVLYRIGGVIQSNTDNILISIFVGTIIVGYYSNYSLIIVSATSFLNIIFSAVKASLGNFVNEKDKKSQLEMFNIFEVFNFWLVGFCFVCFVILIPDFIKIVFGNEYLLSLSALIWMSINFYTSNIRQTIWAYRETTGLFNKTKYITMVTAIINLFMSILLGYRFGLVGIIAATVISRMLYAWWKEPLILFNDYFNISAYKYYINYIKRAILIAVVTFAIYLICYFIPNINIYINFLIKIIISIFTYFIILFVIYKNDKSFEYLKNNILKKLGGNFYERLFKNKQNC